MSGERSVVKSGTFELEDEGYDDLTMFYERMKSTFILAKVTNHKAFRHMDIPELESFEVFCGKLIEIGLNDFKEYRKKNDEELEKKFNRLMEED